MSTMGKLDEGIIERSLALGVNIAGGTLNKKDGRVRIFSRSFPGTSKSGYCLRSRVVWWIYTGEALSGCEFNIHHINHDRADDRIGNLEKLTHVEHAHEHNGYRWQNVQMSCRVCEHCGEEFKIQTSKLKDRSSGSKQRGRFCSAACYQEHPRVLKNNCPQGHEYTEENSYKIIDKYGYKSRTCKTCAKIRRNHRCAAL